MIKFTLVMVSRNELYIYMYRVNSFIFLIKFTRDMVSGNELYIYIYVQSKFIHFSDQIYSRYGFWE